MGIDDRLAGKAKEFEGKATGDATREAVSAKPRAAPFVDPLTDA